MNKIVYICYSRDDQEEIQKVQSTIEYIKEYLEGVSFVMSETPCLDTIEESSVILCVLTPSFTASNDVIEELKYSSNLNKTIVGLFASSVYGLDDIFGTFGHREIKNSIRSGFFNVFPIDELERFVKQMIAYLGLDNPLADAVGAKVSVAVESSHGFKYQIGRYKGVFDKGTILKFRLKPGRHLLSIDSLENDYCSFRDSFEISTAVEQVVRTFDLDSLLEEIGHEGTVVDDQGNRYTGWLVKRLFDGSGVYTTHDGYVYDGVFSGGKIMSGLLIEPSGNQYSGHFKDWKRHGEGKQLWKNTGEMYEGSWEFDHMSGHGMFVASDSSIYEGVFRNDFLISGVVTDSKGKKVQVGTRNLLLKDADFLIDEHSSMEGKELVSESEVKELSKRHLHSLSAICTDGENHRIFCLDGLFYRDESGSILYEGESNCKWTDEGIILVCQIHEGELSNGTFYMDDHTPIVEGVFEDNCFIPREEHFPLWNEFVQSALEDLDISKDEEESLELSAEEVVEEPVAVIEEKIEIKPVVVETHPVNPIEKKEAVQLKPMPVYSLNAIAYPDGSRYEGNLIERKRQGKGSLFLYNGDSYEGYWDEDKFHGEGEYQWSSEEIVFKGTFAHGLPEQGCYYMAGDMPIVSGQWVDNEFVPTEEFFPNWTEFIQDLRFEELD